MFGWFKRVRKPSPKRLIELENGLSDVETAISWLRKAVTDLNARMATIKRQEKASQVDPGATNGDEHDVSPPGRETGGSLPISFRSRRQF